MYLEYFPPKTTFFVRINELYLFWRRNHGVGLNDLKQFLVYFEQNMRNFGQAMAVSAVRLLTALLQRHLVVLAISSADSGQSEMTYKNFNTMLVYFQHTP